MNRANKKENRKDKGTEHRKEKSKREKKTWENIYGTEK
jgi:hypothetical protein